MAKYRLHYGVVHDFDANDAGEVVPHLKMSHLMGDESEPVFIERIAKEMCEWNGKWYRTNNRNVLAEDMIRHGLLECVH